MQSWQNFLQQQQQQEYFEQIQSYVANARQQGKVVYPPEEDVFSAFTATPLDQVKVVILGQDPYHGPDQAHGLSFSVKPGVKTPPSLANMYKELATDIDGFTIPEHGYLQSWAEQGVLLLNTVLTVEQGNAHSHAKIGWETFTDKVIEHIDQECEGVIFLLWGAHAQKKGKKINTQKHHVLKSAHPSPLSAYRGFFGCQHFSQTNTLLQAMNKTPITWQV
ncbi:TPA: uracil-DNA glycosylase [Photobacterium damselae]|uniref:Uracil-DNA glycosylase n=2 Tax=Photobacterium damselae TaxID=38293 RepID=A0ACD3SXI1_PHODM|nr:uracil-DNA glycosylase [Photobacterium damselae]KAB1176930.1 uracil-DNA glycosylase [Photobacterium damselae subsp. damselae]MDC4169058.1 uracil-DNA glycosylase [Photobacterium damselae]PSB87860.1 uracil-DNA glycosylase [Photobacterium damselae subsp. damselae]PSB88340.1 uracil-DNA glycosylase [Photobacterium damselae subsp. damselae]RDL28557.1 uracil-DNA glycosylase [Photobacterium damselae]